MHLSTILTALTLSTFSTANVIPSSSSITIPSSSSSIAVPPSSSSIIVPPNRLIIQSSSSTPAGSSSATPSTTPIPSPSPSPVGQAIITNNCLSPIYLWIVGHEPIYRTSIPAGQSFMQDYFRDKVTGGVALKLTAVVDGVYNKSPQLVLAYTLNEEEGLVYYDLSTVFGSPFEGKEVRLTVGRGQGQDQVLEWKNGIPSTGSGSEVMVLPDTVDLVLSVC